MLNYIKIKTQFNIDLVTFRKKAHNRNTEQKRHISIHQKESTINACLNFSILEALLSTYRSIYVNLEEKNTTQIISFNTSK